MIAYIKGELIEIEPGTVIVETGGIGYQIKVPLSLLESLPKIGAEVKIHTYFQVREDGTSLFGFTSKQDLKMFKQLIAVNGVGPKSALGLLSTLRPDALRMAIVSGDAKAIAKAPGVGIKTAQRIILDLKDKISTEELSLEADMMEALIDLDSAEEALQALISLGYSRSEAQKAVAKVGRKTEKTSEDILKEALKQLAFL